MISPQPRRRLRRPPHGHKSFSCGEQPVDVGCLLRGALEIATLEQFDAMDHGSWVLKSYTVVMLSLEISRTLKVALSSTFVGIETTHPSIPLNHLQCPQESEAPHNSTHFAIFWALVSQLFVICFCICLSFLFCAIIFLWFGFAFYCYFGLGNANNMLKKWLNMQKMQNKCKQNDSKSEKCKTKVKKCKQKRKKMRKHDKQMPPVLAKPRFWIFQVGSRSRHVRLDDKTARN